MYANKQKNLTKSNFYIATFHELWLKIYFPKKLLYYIHIQKQIHIHIHKYKL